MKLEEALKMSKFKNENHKAGLNIIYTAWWLKTQNSTELKKFGLTHEQYNVLRILKGKYPERMCVKDVACRVIEKNSNIPRIVDRLEIKKLVKRTQSEADGRHTLISITDAGLSILESATKKLDLIVEKFLTLNQSEATTLNTLLEKVRIKEV
jgi:DNA-binding MarR family transcriptional regulator